MVYASRVFQTNTIMMGRGPKGYIIRLKVNDPLVLEIIFEGLSPYMAVAYSWSFLLGHVTKI